MPEETLPLDCTIQSAFCEPIIHKFRINLRDPSSQVGFMGVSPKLERIPEESALLPLQLLQIVHFPSPLQALQKKKVRITYSHHIFASILVHFHRLFGDLPFSSSGSSMPQLHQKFHRRSPSRAGRLCGLSVAWLHRTSSGTSGWKYEYNPLRR